MTDRADTSGLGGWLRVVLPRLPAALADEEARVRLLALGRRLPARSAILEARLAPPSRQVDLSLCLRGPAEAGQAAALFPPSPVRALLERRAAGALPAVRSLWLEWDLEPAAAPPSDPALPLPSVIAKLDGPAAPEWVAGELLPALAGGPLPPPQRALAERCLAAVPPPGRLLYAFGLHGRPGGGLRLEVCGLPPSALVACLERLSAGHARRLSRLAPFFAEVADADRLHLSLDLQPDGGIGPRFGVEGSLAGLPRREPGWAALLARLVAAGLCDPGRRDGVLAWPGWDSFRTAPEVWPVAGLAAGRGLDGFCARGLSHVKLVSWPGRPPEAKAYLAFSSVPTAPAPAALRPRERAGARSPAG